MPQPHADMSPPSGSVFMVVAPSGAGKSSLVNALLAEERDIVLSVSCTTREPRPGEIDGEHYHFTDRAAFLALRDQGALLEWAQVHDNYYGTPRDRVESSLRQGRDVLLEIDWQGAQQVRRHYPQAVSVFILPPSVEALAQRLRARGQDSESTIERRLLAAGTEMPHAKECQYVIINQEFSLALMQLRQIIAASRLRYANQAARHAGLFSQLGMGGEPG